MKDSWKILHIMPTRDLAKIKAAYRVRAQKFHPDKASTLEDKGRYALRFIELREAYMHAKFIAQYEPDLEPLYIRPPPDLSRHPLFSRDWLVAVVAIAANLFGLWLVWVSAEHHTVPTLSITPSIVMVALTRIRAFGRRPTGPGEEDFDARGNKGPSSCEQPGSGPAPR